MKLGLWRNEGFPFETFLAFTPDYCISDSWESQGYTIKGLHLSGERVVFRKVAKNMSGLTIPKILTAGKLPDGAVYELNTFFKHIIKKYALGPE